MTRIRNTGTNPAVFHIDDTNENAGLFITPTSGIVMPSESYDVEVLVKPKIAMSYEKVSLTASIRGGKSIVLKLEGEAKVPHITLVEDSFRLGPVVVGSEYRVPLTLVNNSNFPASMMLDLSEHQDLRPSLLYATITKYATALTDENGNILEPISVAQSVSSRHSVSDDHSVGREYSGLWKITLVAQATLKAALVFLPTVPKLHSFSLPLYVPGMGDRTFGREVTAEGLTSRLGVSTFLIDFGDRVVSRDPNSRMTYFKEVVLTNLDQTSSSRMSFELRERDPGELLAVSGQQQTNRDSVSREGLAPVYFISPMKGDLMVGESTVVRITFLPEGHGDYAKNIDVYVSGQPDTTRPYFTLICRGSGVYPRLTFTKHRLVLPNVPLGITSRNSFSIVNNGYDNLELKYRVSPAIPIPLTITFPDGSDVGLTRERATVIVAAKSETPVSWAGKIEFYDSDGEKFSIDVSGCSDNCLLTVYPFVKSYKDRYGFVGLDDQPVIYLSKKEIALLRIQESRRKENQRRQRAQERQKLNMTKRDSISDNSVMRSSLRSRQVSIDAKIEEESLEDQALFDGVDLSRENITVVNDSECRVLLKWLNKFVCRKPFDVEKYPDCIVETNGDIVVDCIEQMSGKKIAGLKPPIYEQTPNSSYLSGKMLSDGPPNAAVLRVQAIEKLIAKYRTILSFLIRSGALLTHVNPLAMLGCDDYLVALETELRRQENDRLTVAMISERKDLGNAEWLSGCKEAWAEVLFQALKVFCLTRVTYKEYKNTPGIIIQETKEDAEIRRAGLALVSNEKKKKKADPVPPEMASSNVYSQAEAVLFAWAGYHIRHAGSLEDSGAAEGAPTNQMFNLDKRLVDLDDDIGTNLFALCQILHSHLPESTKIGGPLSGYTEGEHCTLTNNFERIRTVLLQTRLEFGVSLSELEGSGRNILLLLFHLFLNIPQLIPRTTIEFRGVLGAPIVKTVELKNPSNKRVTYRVSLEGSNDFSVPSDTVIIDPDTSQEFPVSCNARFSKSVTGRLTLWGMREKGVGGTTMVFKLLSTIVDRKPIEVVKKTVSLFEFETFQLTVTNPFNVECTYPLLLQHSHVRSSVLQILGNKPGKQAPLKKANLLHGDQTLTSLLSDSPEKNNAEEKKDEDEEYLKLFEEPIWCTEQSIKLLPRESSVLNINVLPFMLGKYTLQIVMADDSAGEFCYQIEVDVVLGKPSEKVEFSVSQLGNGSSVQRALRINSRNFPFEKAVQQAIDLRLPVSKRMRAKAVVQGYLSYAVTNEDMSTPFAVEIASPYFNAHKEMSFVSDYVSPNPSSMALTRPGTKRLKVNRTAVEDISAADIAQGGTFMLNAVVFSFFPEKAGTYRSRVIAFSKENDLDVRILELVANVTAPVTSTLFEFKGPAKQKLTQDIPIVNESDKDWTLQSVITGKVFSGVPKLIVPKGDKAIYTVTFLSQYPDTFEGSLVLRDPHTNESFEFKLLGIAEEPLAEDHLNLKCLARSKETFSIRLHPVQRPRVPPAGLKDKDGNNQRPAVTEKPKIPGAQIFKVETDLPYVSGAPTVEIGPSGGDYVFHILSPVGGVMSGSITFTEMETGVIVWYTVEVEVSSPRAESTISVQATVRKAVAVEITIDNPTNDTLQFQVSIKGEGLLGDRNFTLPAGQTNASYELIYSPLVEGQSSGSITFMNDRVGEFWYHIQLDALPAAPTVVDTIECMLGATKVVQVPVENPLSVPVKLGVYVSNTENFSVQPEGLVALDPFSQTTFDLCFRPSSLTETASTTVILSHATFGQVRYEATGKGQLPGIMPSVQISTAIGEISSHTIVFRNPFPHPLPVDIILNDSSAKAMSENGSYTQRSAITDKSEDSRVKKHFQLLLRKPVGLVIASKSTLQIGVSFSPEKLGHYSATVQVRSSVSGHSLLWCYPVQGVAEAGRPQILPKLTTQCKTSLMKEINIPLQGLKTADLLPGESLTTADFVIELGVDEKWKSTVNRTFRVQPVDLVRLTDDVTTDYAMKYRLLFEPLRTFNATVQLMVMCEGRGRWRAEAELNATDPEPDDVIELTAAVGSSDKVSFRLSNRFLGYSSFQAYFSVHSSPHFSVTPTSGVLAPYGSDGTHFVVSFAPARYGGREKYALLYMSCTFLFI